MGLPRTGNIKPGIQGKEKMEERLAWIRRLLRASRNQRTQRILLKRLKQTWVRKKCLCLRLREMSKVFRSALLSLTLLMQFTVRSETAWSARGVDGRMVSLDYKVKTGQIVDIITTNSPTHEPNREWLKIAKTSEARSKIRAWFKKSVEKKIYKRVKVNWNVSLKETALILMKMRWKLF